MLEKLEIEVDELTARLTDALICTCMSDLIRENNPSKLTDPEDKEYAAELRDAADTILQYYTTKEEYIQYLELDGEDDA